MTAGAAVAGVVVGTGLPVSAAPSAGPVAASWRVHTAHRGLRVARELAGLSFETLQLGDLNFFDVRDEALVQFLRTLNPNGVLRIGGNTSDFSVWSEYRGKLPDFPQVPHARERRPYVITSEQLDHLAGFLKATGWRLIFGVNLKSDLPEMAAELAVAVQRAVGDRLLAIQIGNEPDDYPGQHGQRFPFDAYFARWQRTAAAIRKRVAVPFAGPDTGASTDWVLAMARRGSGLAALTRHYYRGGATSPSAGIPDVLSGDPRFVRDVAEIAKAGDARGLPFILSEVNSYWGGGKLGVSNTFASALWGGDFMLGCAQAGLHSFNFHGGPLQALEASLSRRAAAAPLGADRLARIDAISGRYTPIAGDEHAGFYARPLYYGMLLAQQFAGAQFVGGDLAARGVNLSAYAALRDGKPLLALFNKDLDRSAQVAITLDVPATRARVWRLSAPAVTDVHHASLAGAQVAADGTWTPRTEETQRLTPSGLSLALPKTSAALVWLEA